jgi:KDO2-lipid IV(A) lauroyltransferase
VKRGYYEASPVVIASPPYEKAEAIVMENYVQAVQTMIEEEPEGWLWSHNRWKKRHLNPEEQL